LNNEILKSIDSTSVQNIVNISRTPMKEKISPDKIPSKIKENEINSFNFNNHLPMPLNKPSPVDKKKLFATKVDTPIILTERKHLDEKENKNEIKEVVLFDKNLANNEKPKLLDKKALKSKSFCEDDDIKDMLNEDKQKGTEKKEYDIL